MAVLIDLDEVFFIVLFFFLQKKKKNQVTKEKAACLAWPSLRYRIEEKKV